MMRRFIFLYVLLLSGCELVPITETPVAIIDLQRAWDKHQLQLNNIDAWTLEGRISVRQDEEVWHVNLRWQQIDSVYHINLFGPFGTGAVQLDGSPQSVVLQHDGQTVRSDDVEKLLRQQLGLQIPVKSLRYWILGLVAPGSEFTQELGVMGRLLVLKQNAWRVRFRAYEQVKGFMLPSKIFLDHDRLDIRLVIDEWKIVERPSVKKIDG